MVFIYPAIIHDDEDGFWAEFPDLEGCNTQGDSQQEILENAKEAMECYLLGLLEQGAVLPKATSPKEIRLPEANTYISLIYGDVDLAKNTKSIKKTLTIPIWLNEQAMQANINFSNVLQKALLKELQLC